ncbi:MAG TPA: amidohydrolase family protein [Longimicrobiaceae bacterium]|nr:amidohydrolase family protein [Longimicrobiaceae bacterium]
MICFLSDRRSLTLVAFLSLLSSPLAAQVPDSAKDSGWEVTQARGDVREIDFTTDEGTWMSVDLSPDERWIVFDMMGHIYRVPAGGGEAESLTQSSGVAYNIQPAYSPDGQSIAFISDREGQNNLWVMDADGSNPEAVFTDMDEQASTPVWTPDGQYIIVTQSSGIWMYHRDGGGGIELISDDEVSNPGWPSVSADGRYLYFHSEVGRGAPLDGNVQLRRYDFETGDIVDLTSGEVGGTASSRLSSGGAFAPEISPDGRYLAYGRKIPDGTISYAGLEYGPRTALWIRDLRTGEERKAMDPIANATQSGTSIIPGYDWTPDGSAIVISQGGKIRRLDVQTGVVETIPMEARVQRTISEQAYTSFRISDGPFQPKFLRWHTESPDGTMLAFQAVGQVWVMELPDGEPRRLTPSSYGDDEFGIVEYAPAWSPDSRSIAFTSLNARNQGHIWKVDAGGGTPQQITTAPAFYTNLEWSPDGRSIIAIRGGGATARGRTVTANSFFEIVRVPADGGEAEFVTTISKPTGMSPGSYARRAIPRPSFGPDGRIFFPDPTDEGPDDGGVVTSLVSVAPDGSDRRVHLTLPNAVDVTPSPDGRYVAFEQGGNVYVTPFPRKWVGREPVHMDKSDGKLPVEQLTFRGGLFPSWQSASTLEFGNANEHFTYNVLTEERDSTLIEFTVPTDRAQGTVALVGARIIPMNPDGPEVIPSGVVVVQDGRISCVGATNECDTSGADRVIDASGKTIMPGIIDMHAHHYRENRGHRPPNDYESAIYLAYGVTTNLDNSMWSQNIFPTAERIRAGRLIGPRTYSTGDPLYEGDGPDQNEINSYDDAKNNVLRLKSWGAVSIKQYSNPRRDQRQWIIDAAREAGIMVTGHWRPGIIMDGHTGHEHAFPYVPLFDDITNFYGQADAVYVPTMVVSGPGPSNLEYWIAESKVWQDDKQQRWMPWRNLTFMRWRELRPPTDYSFPLVAQGMKEIIEAGGWGSIGGHGEHHALTPHWEIWMAAEAMGEMDALRVATMHGAHFLGAQEDVGSLEEGKLADLLVLNSNPLEDIRSTADIQYVMKDGRIYQADTLDEVWPDAGPFGPYYWLDEGAFVDDTIPIDVP